MQSMVATVLYWSGFGRPRRVFISVPYIAELLDEPGPTLGRKYIVLPDEPEPPPTPSPRRRWEPQPRRGGKEIIPLLDD